MAGPPGPRTCQRTGPSWLQRREGTACRTAATARSPSRPPSSAAKHRGLWQPQRAKCSAAETIEDAQEARRARARAVVAESGERSGRGAPCQSHRCTCALTMPLAFRQAVPQHTHRPFGQSHSAACCADCRERSRSRERESGRERRRGLAGAIDRAVRSLENAAGDSDERWAPS